MFPMSLGSEDLILTVAVMVLAAGVKGFIGFGMPTVAMALLTLFMDLRLAIALILVPMLASNAIQAVRGPHLRRVVRDYWRYGALLALSVAITVWFSQEVPEGVLKGVLGAAILAYCLLSWRRMVPDIPDRANRAFEAAAAILGGILGGLTAGWAPPMVMYLLARGAERDVFVQALGFLIAVGTVPLMIGYMLVGHASLSQMGLSMALVVPTALGYAVGEALRKRTEPGIFRSLLLGIFALFGLNLLATAFISL